MTRAKRAGRAFDAQAEEARAPWERLACALVYVAVFVYASFPYSDFDWGWHYRYGEYFFTHGQVLRHDLYSWTMPGYEWVNHSWLFDPLLYLIYTRFSFIGLSIAGALATVLTFHLCVRRAHLAYWQMARGGRVLRRADQRHHPAGAADAGRRAPVARPPGRICSSGSEEGQNWPRWVLPVLFCLWANLHGSFLLGLVVFGVYVAWELVLAQARGSALHRRWFMFAGSFIASIAATLVNPFTYGVYVEARRHFGNPHLTYVVEWMPPDFSQVTGLLFLAYTLVVAYGFFARKKLADVPALLVAAGTFYMAVSSRRHVAVFVVLTLPIVALVIKDVRFRVGQVVRVGAVVAVIMALFGFTMWERRGDYYNLLHPSMHTYCLYGPHCSEGVTEYLLQHPPGGRGFNFYDWGGHLIGRGVRAKLYIDGRMHLWERSDFQPMADYRAIYALNDLDAFRAQKFDWILVPRNSDFVKNLVAAVSPSTGVRESDQWIVKYQDNWALYAVRRPDLK